MGLILDFLSYISDEICQASFTRTHHNHTWRNSAFQYLTFLHEGEFSIAQLNQPD